MIIVEFSFLTNERSRKRGCSNRAGDVEKRQQQNFNWIEDCENNAVWKTKRNVLGCGPGSPTSF